MLHTEAPFPYVGASAFLRPDADCSEARPCRVLQHRADGRVSIAFTGREYSARHPDAARRASGNRTVEFHQLAATAEEAIPPVATSAVAASPKRRRKARA